MIGKWFGSVNLERQTITSRNLAVFGIGLAVLSASAMPNEVDNEVQETYIGEETFGSLVSTAGDIRVPKNFRTDYVMLGSWSVSGDADTGGEIGLHVVYTTKEAVKAYKRTGFFPDGTIIVKELFSGHTDFLTTGEATRADKEAGHFVMIKDSIGRFEDNPLWGDGWGWAFFGAGNNQKTESKNYKEDCMGCHVPAVDTDYIYTGAYPVLKK